MNSEIASLDRARLALEGLSVGDSFGERFFGSLDVVESSIERRALPSSPWYWTDDTAMSLSIYEVLSECGRIDPDVLAVRFADRYRRDPMRGYGGTAHIILTSISQGVSWRAAAGQAFDGMGSKGNGAAMRAAPIGAFFADDLDEVVENARASAAPTHAHPDGQAGAVAVAVAAAVAWRMGAGLLERSGETLFREVIARTPDGETRLALLRAASHPPEDTPRAAASALGSGGRIISSDTVPFCIWCAARHLDNYEEAMWNTVLGLGDRDTTCAIVGGIVALSTGLGMKGIPKAFLAAREPLELEILHREGIEESR